MLPEHLSAAIPIIALVAGGLVVLFWKARSYLRRRRMALLVNQEAMRRDWRDPGAP